MRLADETVGQVQKELGAVLDVVPEHLLLEFWSGESAGKSDVLVLEDLLLTCKNLEDEPARATVSRQ